MPSSADDAQLVALLEQYQVHDDDLVVIR